MNKQLLVSLFVICVIVGGIYFFQEENVAQDIVETTSIFKKDTEVDIISTHVSKTISQQTDSIVDTQQDIFIEDEKSEPRFEEILYPDEYDFKSLRAGPVYEKAGTKIKVDFSYILDKKLGDEVTVHFPNASVTGEIVHYETDNGPEGMIAYIYRIDVNNSITEGGSIPERIFLSVFEQNNILTNVDGSYEIPNADGLFYLEKGIGYFATKEDYGKIAQNYKMD